MNLRRQSVHLMTMEKEQVLVLENITKAYGTRFSKEKKRVLGPVSLCIRKGEAVGITGENGAGKSTLLSVAAGIERMREKSNLRRSDADSWDTFRRKSHFIPH